MADKGKSVPRFSPIWCGDCTARFKVYCLCIESHGVPGKHFEPFKNWAHVSDCHNNCAPWLRKIDRSVPPGEDWTFPCPWCEKPKEEYKMRGKESKEWYYIEESIPVTHKEVAGEHMGGQTHPGGHRGGSTGMMHGGLTGETMGGEMHPGGHQGGNTGTMHGGVTGEHMGGSKNVFFDPREDSAIISQYGQGTPYDDMNKDVDINNNRSSGTLQRRFEQYLVPKMNPSEVKSLREERQRNINIRMDQASSSAKTKPAEPAKKGGQRAEKVPFNQREDSAIKSQFRRGIPYEDMNKHDDIYSNRRYDSLRNRFELALVPKMDPSEVASLRAERERKFKWNPKQRPIPHPQQHSLGQPGPSMHSGRSHEDQGGHQAGSLGSSSGDQRGQVQHQPPPGLTQEERQAYGIIIQSVSAIPKCSLCFFNRKPCDNAEPSCSTCVKLDPRWCHPLTAENINTKKEVQEAMIVCRELGWILRDLTEDELRFMNRAMAHQSLLGCEYCIRNELTGCDILSSQPCQRCASRNRQTKEKAEPVCRFVSGNTILEKRKFIEGRLREHETPARLESQLQTSHPQQHSLGQAGSSMHSGRSHEGFVSQGIAPIHQEQHTNPFSEVSSTGVGSSPPERRAQLEEEIAKERCE